MSVFVICKRMQTNQSRMSQRRTTSCDFLPYASNHLKMIMPNRMMAKIVHGFIHWQSHKCSYYDNIPLHALTLQVNVIGSPLMCLSPHPYIHTGR